MHKRNQPQINAIQTSQELGRSSCVGVWSYVCWMYKRNKLQINVTTGSEAERKGFSKKPPFAPIIHNGIANDRLIYLQKLMYIAFSSFLGLVLCFF
ncbi:hypothetical protein SLE2022_317970 [Rubroshorea leprosula]